MKSSIWPTDLKGALVFVWIVLIHVTALVGLFMYSWPGWPMLMASLSLVLLGGIGCTVCYHRALAHQSLTLNPFVQAVGIFFAMLTGVTPPGAWIPNHRYHHAMADTREDPSSPIWHGLWASHFAWYWQAAEPVPAKYNAGLGSFSLRIWEWLMPPIFILAFFGGAVFGLRGFFWLGAIRMVFAFHANSLVNSICHNETTFSGTTGSSRNVWWVAFPLLLLGENWHRNHHSSPGSARLGWNWRQPDLGYVLILALEKLGLATDVRITRALEMADGD